MLEELREWLAKRVTRDCNKTSIILGLSHGQDFNRLRDRNARMLSYLIALTNPNHAWFSFPCGCWGPWSRFNVAKEGEQFQKPGSCNDCKEATAMRRTRSHPKPGRVFETRIDMCSMGMRCPKTNMQVLKPTKIITAVKELADTLEVCRCDHQHEYAHLEGKYEGRNLSSWCEMYPNKFCRVISEMISIWSNPKSERHDVCAEKEDFPDEIQREGKVPDQEGVNSETSRCSARIKALAQKLHTSAGHASREQVLRRGATSDRTVPVPGV